MNPEFAPPIDDAQIEDLFLNASLDDLKARAQAVTQRVHGNAVLLRGLIEYSNYCIKDCHYCGIRASNDDVQRYRMTPEDILAAVKNGFNAGIRTFVLQGGEDPIFTADVLAKLTTRIKQVTNNESAVTLSAGYFDEPDLQRLRDAGVDRYLLRFETSDTELHTTFRDGETLMQRTHMLYVLKELGFQVGSGFMVGLPGETDETLINNIRLCQLYGFDMVGVGPFIPHPNTPLKDAKQHDIERSLRCVALLRLALPKAHIPATTAAGSLDPLGREKMVSCGANVLMPNLTPTAVKPNYLLYPGKICLDESGEQCIGCMRLRMKTIDREVSFHRGDAIR